MTKILATTPLILALLAQGRIQLEHSVARYIPSFNGGGREKVRIVHLLEHSSGLVAWRPYYEEVAAAYGGAYLATRRGRDAIRTMVASEEPETRPGRRDCYSDLGFILLEWIIERVTGKTLDVFFRERIARPLGVKSLFFVDLKSPRRARAIRARHTIAATVYCPWRGRTLAGEVHDDNAYAMGGVSGHAGLFGTARGVGRLASSLLDAYQGRRSLFDPGLVRRFWLRSEIAGSTRALGFDTPSPRNSQAGRRLGPNSVGHTGYTGTSLWIDPDQSLVVVLLTNRVHPGQDSEKARNFRPHLHDRVVEVFG